MHYGFKEPLYEFMKHFSKHTSAITSLNQLQVHTQLITGVQQSTLFPVFPQKHFYSNIIYNGKILNWQIWHSSATQEQLLAGLRWEDP